MIKREKIILIIMDGWGLGNIKSADAIQNASTPFINSLYDQYPHTTLITHAESVGLPKGQMGNSEVGHLNIGAGRVVFQELLRINKMIVSGQLQKNEVLNSAFRYAKENNKPVHFMGLVSDGGVHSHIEHLKALCTYASEYGLKDFFVHAFTDGRDCDPRSGIEFIEELQDQLHVAGGEIASVVGRYYAMDRDKRWQRIKEAYDLLTEGNGKQTQDLLAAVQESYDDGVTDEFIKPIVKTDETGKPVATIKEDDVVICFNFRTDRCREITQVLTQSDFPDFGMKKINLHYVTLTEYDHTFQNVQVMLDHDNLPMTLGEVLSKAGKKQLRIAETEKYPHVSFFFSGQREEPFDGEERILIPSPKVATYDLQPEMSAPEVRDRVVEQINSGKFDFICLNFANVDMVGHTGVFEAAVKAVETIDQCVQATTEAALQNNYAVFIIADHGNADYIINEDGSPNTAHSMNPVPFIVADRTMDFKIRSGKLADIAPTILTMMDIPVPNEMTGEILISDL